MSTSQVSTREHWADVCRVFAISGVVLIHACGIGLYKYGEISSGEWLAINFLDSLVRCSVPLFVMLSGALLLNRDKVEALSAIWLRIKKVLLPLMTWGIFFLLYVAHYTREPVTIWNLFVKVPMYHMWFIYMIVGIYLLLPIYQSIYRMISCNKEYATYLFILWFCVTCIPIYVSIPLIDLLQLKTLFGYGGYFVMGAVLKNIDYGGKYRFFGLDMYICGFFLTFLLTIYLSQRSNALDETAYLYFSPNVLLASVGAFIFIRKLSVVHERVRKVLYLFSEYSFLIFFMHVIVLDRVQKSSFMRKVTAELTLPVSVVGSTIVTLIVCFCIAFLLRRVPYAKKIIG